MFALVDCSMDRKVFYYCENMEDVLTVANKILQMEDRNDAPIKSVNDLYEYEFYIVDLIDLGDEFEAA